MTISEINSFTTLRTGADTNAYTAANRLISTNRWYHKIVTMILASQDEWDWDDSNRTDYPEATTNLVAGQQDYVFPGSLKILKIKRVEAYYNGSWKHVSPLDINQVNGASDTTSITEDFGVDTPYYDTTANAIKLYPIPTGNVSGGLKIWFTREPAEFSSAEVTTGTKEPGFDEPFHIMIPLGMAYDWLVSKNASRATLVWQELQDYETRLKQYYGSKQKDRDITLQSSIPNNYGA